jgi:hypothetical protein
MRKLLWAVLIAAAAWSAWWIIGSTIKERAILGWLEERRATGWVASTGSLNVVGYPNRFDTRITDIELADPAQGWAWSAPEFEILALSYQPNKVIAIWPQEQSWSNPFGTVRILSEDMRGSIAFRPSTALELDALTVDIKGLKLAGPGWDAGLESGIVATRRATDAASTDFAHDLAITARNVTLPDTWQALADRSGALPEIFSEAALETTLRFDRAWDRHAIESRSPLLTGFHLDKLRLNWGDLQLDAQGDITIDDQGYFAGELQFRARNWRDVLQVLVDSGALSTEVGGLIRRGLGLLAGLSGDPRTIDATMTFADGGAYIGPIRVGFAPRLAR